MISVVIPTRNRPQDLSKAVKSILEQTIIPDELIIVDQSSTSESHEIINALFNEIPSTKPLLNYLHDSSISGLVEAKNIGVNLSSGEIIFFLEDDIKLDPSYISEILHGFDKFEAMLGCCGVITNSYPMPAAYAFFFHLFHVGVFRDNRVGYKKLLKYNPSGFISSDKLSGGISAWRRRVFDVIKFDMKNKFHMLEDIDFSMRAAKFFGLHQNFFINTNAKLEHYYSPVNRDFDATRQFKKVSEYFTLYRKMRGEFSFRLSFCWLLIGLFFEALYQSLRNGSIKNLIGFFNGVKHGLVILRK